MDQHASTPYTVDEHWQNEFDDLLQNYFPRRSANVLGQFRGVNLYPDTAAPSFNQHGGFIEPGFDLRVRASIGTIYYTLNGEDPRLMGGGISPDAIEGGESAGATLLRPEAAARAIVPTNGALGLSWTDPDFDDASWRTGTTGVGYEDGNGYQDLIGLDIIDLANDTHPTVYIRIEFDVEDPSFDTLTLRMRYDDGFVAYINGVQVASANAPANPQWDSSASDSHSDGAAVVPQPFDITDHIDSLRIGRNVLAIHGLNTSAGSSDFLLLPEIAGSAVTGDGVILNGPTLVKARALDGNEWSALNEAQFVVDTPLRITEVMYHPAAPEEGSPFDEAEFEFVELQNISGSALDLDGVSIQGGITFDFTGSAVTELQPGEIVVLVEDIDAFATRYNVGNMLVGGEYSGRLENMGENLRLVGPYGEHILNFDYDDEWHPETDGTGPSLVIIDPLSEDRDSWQLGESWRSSDFPFGSPGVDESDGGLGGRQLPGAANADGRQDVSDVVRLLRHLFQGGGFALACGDGTIDDPGNLTLFDFNGDGGVNLTDGVAQLTYLFRQGPAHAQGTQCLRLETCPEDCGF